METWTLIALIVIGMSSIYFLILLGIRRLAKGRKLGTPKIEMYGVRKVKTVVGKKTIVTEEVIDKPEYQPFHALKTNKSKRSIRYWKDWVLDKLFTSKVVLINLELQNGFHKQFLVIEHDGGFVWNRKKYIFDNESKYYVIDSRLYAYDFHESFVLPIRRKIPITTIQSSIDTSGISEVEYATNPSTLERFMTAKIAEGIMKGQQIDVELKQMRLMLIIVTVITLAHFLFFLQKTGVFAAVKVPGLS